MRKIGSSTILRTGRCREEGSHGIYQLN
jgi:hypothetical protein